MVIKSLIAILNDALNRETSAAIRNLLQLTVVVGAEGQAIRAAYSRRISLEMKHAQTIVDLIAGLWGVPFVTTDFALPPGDKRSGAHLSLIEMLQKDALDDEFQAGDYLRTARLAGFARLPRVKTKLIELAAQKIDLASEMRRIIQLPSLLTLESSRAPQVDRLEQPAAAL